MPSIENNKILDKKRAAIIVSFRDFRDKEYFIPKEILESKGIEVFTVSDKSGIAVGADGGEAKVDILLSDLDFNDFEAIIFIGGPGCLKSLDNEKSYQIIQKAFSQNKILGAICIAPVILAKAGILADKKATVWSAVLDKKGIKILEENGVFYQNEPVVIDENIITADGPEAASEFGEKIFELLTKTG